MIQKQANIVSRNIENVHNFKNDTILLSQREPLTSRLR